MVPFSWKELGNFPIKRFRGQETRSLANPLEAKEILLKYANLDASITAKLSNAPIKKFSELTDQDFSQTQAFADLLASEGVLTKEINVSKMILTPGEIT